MKFKWRKRKFTFVVIPDANQSVLRFNIWSSVVYAVPAIIVAAALTIMLLLGLYQHSAGKTKELQMQLQNQIDRYDHVVSEKEDTIEKLQINVIELSTHASQVNEKLAELEQLQNEIEAISEGEPTSSRPVANDLAAALTSSKINPVTIASTQLSGFDYGMNIDTEQTGGTYHELTNEDLQALANDTLTQLLSMQEEMAALQQGLEQAKETALEYQYLLSITPSIWPTKSRKLTSRFGYRRDPFTRAISFHSGIDISGNSKDPVYAAAAGKIEFSGYDKYSGHHVIVNHGRGLKTIYMHLSKRLVKAGDTVQKGEQIGLLGSTGRSTGPHLHYEVVKFGKKINPLPYMTSS